MKAGLIYRVRDHSINQDLGRGEEARTGRSEVRAETQQGNVYMNGNTGRQGQRGTINKT